ncbi:hypothetical protein BH11PAT1_BH11PAT1_3960 [soil metagenome]
MHEGKVEDVTALIEAYLFHYDWFMSYEGLVYCQGLQLFFNQGAKKI